MSKIKSFDFCRVVSAKKLKGSGLNMGDVVMVLGTKQVPASSKDPYLTRTLVIVAIVTKDELLIPKETNSYVTYLVDPRSLEKLNEDDMKLYEAIIQKTYG